MESPVPAQLPLPRRDSALARPAAEGAGGAVERAGAGQSHAEYQGRRPRRVGQEPDDRTCRGTGSRAEMPFHRHFRRLRVLHDHNGLVSTTTALPAPQRLCRRHNGIVSTATALSAPQQLCQHADARRRVGTTASAVLRLLEWSRVSVRDHSSFGWEPFCASHFSLHPPVADDSAVKWRRAIAMLVSGKTGSKRLGHSRVFRCGRVAGSDQCARSCRPLSLPTSCRAAAAALAGRGSAPAGAHGRHHRDHSVITA
jgi:hypothetical protein